MWPSVAGNLLMRCASTTVTPAEGWEVVTRTRRPAPWLIDVAATAVTATTGGCSISHVGEPARPALQQKPSHPPPPLPPLPLTSRGRTRSSSARRETFPAPWATNRPSRRRCGVRSHSTPGRRRHHRSAVISTGVPPSSSLTRRAFRLRRRHDPGSPTVRPGIPAGVVPTGRRHPGRR